LFILFCNLFTHRETSITGYCTILGFLEASSILWVERAGVSNGPKPKPSPAHSGAAPHIQLHFSKEVIATE